MPRAVKTHFSRVHHSQKSVDSNTATMVNNPLFKTECFGQHALKNSAIPQEIVDAAKLRPMDQVLEIGPGTGNLTVKILEDAHHVTVAAEYIIAELPYFDVCISNTPYKISSVVVDHISPQVESSNVLLVPHNPPPQVKFEEFDGLTEVVFAHKNKTVQVTFLHSGVIPMLEDNWHICISTLIDETGFSEERAAKMSVDDLLKLLLAFHENGIHFA
ncbi:S-adenosyl-L-methionine-dependent methyltransferase [Mycena sp. CBHHK59/15]|nr:S-adenosyl-L-methionine-dependent methyltransferase [Mycena sp. CBHHK59/15]